MTVMERVGTDQRKAPRRWPTAAGLAALAVVSGLLRLGGRDLSLWVDEGISMGIASHPLADIPALLRMDGSPPLYYLVLNRWIGAFGASEAAVRALSLVVALAGVPVAWWAARRLFGERAGWVAAALVAFSSYLTEHSREARMYPLVVVLGLVVVTAFVQVFLLRRRRLLAVLVLSLSALVYTHHWGLFLATSLVVALPLCLRAAGTEWRPVLLDAGITVAGVALLYAPWVPTLVAQVDQTGAPWSRVPSAADALGSLPAVLGGPWVALVLAAAVASLVVGLVRRPPDAAAEATGAVNLRQERSTVAVLGVVLGATVVAAWLSSQLEAAWSSRYFGVFLPPLVLLCAVALARAGRAGALALAGVVALWVVPSFGDWKSPSTPVPKSNVAELAERLEPVVRPGDVVMATQFEQVPLLRHYLGPGLRYADPTGEVADPSVADWRNVLDRMAAARPGEVLAPLVAGLEPGGHVVLACPRLFTDAGDALWYRLMDRHCVSAGAALASTPGLAKVWGPVPPRASEEVGAAMAVTLYRHSSEGAPR